MAAARPTGLYRTLLRLARTLPKPKRDSVVADIKSKWQAVKSETNVDACVTVTRVLGLRGCA